MICQGCKKRYPACHDHCESYLKWKAERDKLREEHQKELALDCDRIRAMVHTKEKTRRSHR